MAPDSDPGQQSGDSETQTRNDHPAAPNTELLFSSTVRDASVPFSEGDSVSEGVASDLDGETSNGDSPNEDLGRGLHDVGSITPPIFPGPVTTDVPPIDDVLGLNDLAFGKPSLSTIHVPDVEVEVADELAALFLPLDSAASTPGDAFVSGTDIDGDIEGVEAEDAGAENVDAEEAGASDIQIQGDDGGINSGASTAVDTTVLDSLVAEVKDAPASGTGPLVVPIVESAGLFGAEKAIAGSAKGTGPPFEGSTDGSPGQDASPTDLGSAGLWPDESKADEVVVESAPDTQNLSSVGDLAGALKLSTEAARPGGMQWSTVIYEPGSEPPEDDPDDSAHQALFVESAELPESERVRRLPASPGPVVTSLIPGSLLEAAERRWFLTAIVGAVALSCGLLAYLVLGGDDGQTDAALAENNVENETPSTADAPPSSEFSEPLSPALSIQQESPVSAQLTQQTAPAAVEQAPAQPRTRSTSAAKSTTKVQSASASATGSSSSTSSTSTTLPPVTAGPASTVPSTFFVTAPTTSTTARPVVSLTTVLQVGPPTVRVTTTRATTTQRSTTTRPRVTTTTRPRPTTTTPRPTTTRPTPTRPTPTTTRPTTTRPTPTTTRPTTTTTRPTTTTTRLTTTTTRLTTTTTTRPTTTTTASTTTTTTSTRPTTTTTITTTTTTRPTTTTTTTTTSQPTSTVASTTTEPVTTTTEQVTTTTEEVTTTTEESTTTTEDSTTTTEEATTTTVDSGSSTTETTTPPASTLVAPLSDSPSTVAASKSTTRPAAS